jgi:hypothetical protein
MLLDMLLSVAANLELTGLYIYGRYPKAIPASPSGWDSTYMVASGNQQDGSLGKVYIDTGMEEGWGSAYIIADTPLLMYRRLYDVTDGSDPDTYDFVHHLGPSGEAAAGRKTVYRCDRQYDDLYGNGFNEVTAICPSPGKYTARNARRLHQYNTSTNMADFKEHHLNKQDGMFVMGNSYFGIMSGVVLFFGGNAPVVCGVTVKQLQDESTTTIDEFEGSNEIYENMSLCHMDSQLLLSYLDSTGINGLKRDDDAGSVSMVSDINHSGCYWACSGELSSFMIKNPKNPAYLCAPYCDINNHLEYLHTPSGNLEIYLTSGCVDWQDTSPDFYGVGISGVTAGDSSTAHSIFPKYYNWQNRRLRGFWEFRTFNWYYFDAGAEGNSFAPSANSYNALIATHYYSKIGKPVNFNGIVYAPIKYDTGYVKIDEGGIEYIDDNIIYGDMKVFNNEVIGIGNEILETIKEYDARVETTNPRPALKKRLVINTFNSKGKLKYNLSQTSTPLPNDKGSMVIHKGVLYIGIGGDKFLYALPTHKKMTLTGEI